MPVMRLMKRAIRSVRRNWPVWALISAFALIIAGAVVWASRDSNTSARTHREEARYVVIRACGKDALPDFDEHFLGRLEAFSYAEQTIAYLAVCKP